MLTENSVSSEVNIVLPSVNNSQAHDHCTLLKKPALKDLKTHLAVWRKKRHILYSCWIKPQEEEDEEGVVKDAEVEHRLCSTTKWRNRKQITLSPCWIGFSS